MANNRYVNTRFWKDSYIVTLDIVERYLFLYFLTNPQTDISGVYEITLREICFDTGIEEDMVLKIINRFSKADKIYYIDGWIIVRNFAKHQKLNANMRVNVDKTVKALPTQVRQTLRNGSKPFEMVPDLIESNSTEQKAKKEGRKRPAVGTDVRDIFEHWQEVWNHPTTILTADRKSKITARLKEGYTIHDLKDAVEGIKYSTHHMGNNDRGEKYLDLTHICKNGSNVEKFRDYHRGINRPKQNGNGRIAKELPTAEEMLASQASRQRELKRPPKRNE